MVWIFISVTLPSDLFLVGQWSLLCVQMLSVIFWFCVDKMLSSSPIAHENSGTVTYVCVWSVSLDFAKLSPSFRCRWAEFALISQ